jgi:hypothetical protein
MNSKWMTTFVHHGEDEGNAMRGEYSHLFPMFISSLATSNRSNRWSSEWEKLRAAILPLPSDASGE